MILVVCQAFSILYTFPSRRASYQQSNWCYLVQNSKHQKENCTNHHTHTWTNEKTNKKTKSLRTSTHTMHKNNEKTTKTTLHQSFQELWASGAAYFLKTLFFFVKFSEFNKIFESFFEKGFLSPIILSLIFCLIKSLVFFNKTGWPSLAIFNIDTFWI